MRRLWMNSSRLWEAHWSDRYHRDQLTADPLLLSLSEPIDGKGQEQAEPAGHRGAGAGQEAVTYPDGNKQPGKETVAAVSFEEVVQLTNEAASCLSILRV